MSKKKDREALAIAIQTSWLEDEKVADESIADTLFNEADKWEMDIARLHEENA